jgi:N utilization substance protein A
MVKPSVEDDDCEITLRKARSVDAKSSLGDTVLVPFSKPIGRIEIIKAKQIIAQKIRQIETSKIYEEFKPKEGSIVHGVVHRCERNGIIVKIQDKLAFLPKSLMIPGEKCVPGHTVRALLKEVLDIPRNENQLILDRSSPEFLKELFDLEIPEVFEKIVVIKNIVRSAGYKSKVVVFSNDKNIDPIGTCVGVGGSRIRPILQELVSEKIDIMGESSSVEGFVKDSLRPAVVDKVEVSDSVARVWLDDDQRSLAIGRLGKNINLASQLTGLSIELVEGQASSKNQTIEDIFGEDDSSGEKDSEK